MSRAKRIVFIVVSICFNLRVRAAGPTTAPASYEPIEGVQAAALDQPRIYVSFRRGNAKAAPLAGKPGGGEEEKMLKQLGLAADAADNGPRIGAEAFLDTGAGGVMLSTDTLEQLGIKTEQTRDGHAVTFEDVGVGGTESFGVAEPLFVALAPFPK